MKVKKNTVVVIVAFVLVLVGIAYTLFGENPYPNGNQGGSEGGDSLEVKEYPDVYSESTCVCLERERPKCSSGWTLNEKGTLCKQEGKYKNVLLGCSKYNCLGDNYIFNQTTKDWDLE